MPEVKKDRSLGVGERPVIKAKYAHMLPEDHATWTLYLKKQPGELHEIWYDVHVGQPMAVPKGAPEYMKNVVDGVSRKRIDVVGRTGTNFYIIEVKPHANMEAVGQVITYALLFANEFEVRGPVKPMIVATTCDRDILQIAQNQNVKIIALEGVTL